MTLSWLLVLLLPAVDTTGVYRPTPLCNIITGNEGPHTNGVYRQLGPELQLELQYNLDRIFDI